jgi:hypothetical protein
MPRPEKATKKPANGSGRSAVKRTGAIVRTEPDVPLEVLEKTYSPTQTSLKTSFRATGVDQQRDQELAGGFADDRWNDEDHFTNKSGDPRIGTHGRTYEPDEGHASPDK